MQASNEVVFTRPELLCFGIFLLLGLSLVLAIRHPKQVIAGIITIPISGLCGGFAYLIASVMYGSEVGIFYGFAAFAFTGLIIMSALRWLSGMDTF